MILDETPGPHDRYTIEVTVTREPRYGNYQCRAWVASYQPRVAVSPGLGVIGNAPTRGQAMREVLSHMASLIAADERGEDIASDTPDVAHLVAGRHLRIVGRDGAP